jgi:hypothetical protein
MFAVDGWDCMDHWCLSDCVVENVEQLLALGVIAWVYDDIHLLRKSQSSNRGIDMVYDHHGMHVLSLGM